MRDELMEANKKRTYDEYQGVSLDQQRAINAHVVSVLEDTHNLCHQVSQNAIESANLASKQALAHRDIAIDRQWNVDEVAELVAKTPIFLDAIAAQVAESLKK